MKKNLLSLSIAVLSVIALNQSVYATTPTDGTSQDDIAKKKAAAQKGHEDKSLPAAQ